MKKFLKLILALMLIITLTSCGGSKSKDSSNDKNDVVEKDDKKDTKKEIPKEIKPKKALPKNVPVYPKSYIIDDLQEDENTWLWTFYAPASAKEIKQFFEDELSYLGLQIQASKALMGPLFDVVTLDYAFVLGFVDESDRTVDENTSDREYVIGIVLDDWDDSLKRDKENDPRPKIDLETQDSSKFGDYKPERDVPKILPVYPYSTLLADMATTMTGTKWMWEFRSNATVDEIIEYYETELADLEIEFNAHKEDEFFMIQTKNSIIEIMGMYIEDEQLGGAGYNYSVQVDLVALSDF